MSESNKTLGQQYHEQVEALKADGVSNAEAIRQVAAKHGKKENAVRGGIHQYKSAHLAGDSGPRRARRSSGTSVEDHIVSARRSLEAALSLVDQEVAQAKTALETAQARYDEAVASVKERKADIQKKLRALS